MATRDWQNHEPPKGYVTGPVAADMMGVSVRTMRRWIAKGAFNPVTCTDPIPGVPWTHNEVFFSVDSIEDFLKRQR